MPPYGRYELRTYGPKPIAIATVEYDYQDHATVYTTYALWRGEPYRWDWVTDEGREGMKVFKAALAQEGFDPDWN